MYRGAQVKDEERVYYYDSLAAGAYLGRYICRSRFSHPQYIGGPEEFKLFHSMARVRLFSQHFGGSPIIKNTERKCLIIYNNIGTYIKLLHIYQESRQQI